MNRLAMIVIPNPMIVGYSENGFHCYVWEKEFNDRYGRYAAQQRETIVRCTALSFTDGLQEDRVSLVDHGLGLEVRLNGCALTQLMLYHGKFRSNNRFSTLDLPLFLEGQSLNAAEGWILNVGVHLMAGTPLEELPKGSFQYYSVKQERERNAQFWRDVGAPVPVEVVFI